MTILVPSPDQALHGLRAVKTVISAAGPIDATRRAFVDAAQKHLLHTAHDLDWLEPITPDALAEAVADPRLRAQLSQTLCLYVMVPDQPDPAEVRAAERFVHALGGAADALDRMRAVYEHRMIALRFDAMRSSFLGDTARRRMAEVGPLSVLQALGALLGVYESEAVAERYRALGALPEGTLGRAFHEFYTANGFPFPGEKGGAPEGVVTHDLSHVLAGYGTDLRSEACMVAFQAGYRREGPYGGLLFVLLNVQKGVQLTRLAPGAVHLLDEPGMPERVVDAWVRGGAVTLDLAADWDYWSDMERSLDEVRARYHVAAVR
jgi:hypothetical protein